MTGDNGKNILVDAGFLGDSEEAKSRKVSGYVRPDSMLLRIGIKAEDITDVILNHPILELRFIRVRGIRSIRNMSL